MANLCFIQIKAYITFLIYNSFPNYMLKLLYRVLKEHENFANIRKVLARRGVEVLV